MNQDGSYEAVVIILHDSEKRLLLQHRTTDAPIMPNYWAFFGGGIKQGETPEEAVRRETFEELEYHPLFPELVREQDFEEGKIKGHLYIFIERFHGDKASLKLNEGQGWGWFKASEIGNLRMVDRDRDIVRWVDYHINIEMSH